MFFATYNITSRSAKSNAIAIWLCQPAVCYINYLYITKTDVLALADSPFTASNSWYNTIVRQQEDLDSSLEFPKVDSACECTPDS